MASDIPLRSARLPTQQQVIELLADEFTRAGYDVEDVVIEPSARPPRIVVVADSDTGLDLDALATLSQLASGLLDQLVDAGEDAPYVLEVTSPGVERPLTVDRHYRRARGRRVEMTLADGSQVVGRVGEVADGVVALVVPDRRGKVAVRAIALEDIVKAVVQVEFSPPNPRELELAGVIGREAGE